MDFSDYWKSVNARDYGAAGDGSTDDTAAIQAAIDAASNAGISGVYLPASAYKISSPIYLDPPGNLRSNFANPTNFHNSMCLYGDHSLGNIEEYGTRIKPATDNFTALYVGPGQGMRVSNLTFRGVGSSYRGNQNSNGLAIGLCGGNGGSSRTLIDNVGIYSFYTGIKTGANGNGALCDSNTFSKVWTDNCYRGLHIPQTQNFINSAYDCNFGNSTYNVVSDVGCGIHIFGGNYSSSSAQAHKFSISSVSSLTSIANGNSFNYSFTAVVASPDIYIGSVYTHYMIVTAHFGVIPCTMTNWNSGTSTGTFMTLPIWGSMYFNQTDAKTATDLQAEIQAVSSVYAAEVITTFTGANVHVDGVHIENTAPTTVFRSFAGFGSNRPNTLKNTMFNVDPSLPMYAPANSPSDANLAMHYAAVTVPFISVENNDLSVSDNEFNCTSPVCLDFSNPAYQFAMDRCRNIRLNVRVAGNGGFQAFGDPTGVFGSSGLGAGKFDVTPFTPILELTYTGAASNRTLGWGASPFEGARPAPWTRPIVTPSQVSDLTGTLPAITYSAGQFTIPYPVLWGGQQYAINDWYTGVQAGGYNIVSNHHFYSLGQNITTTNCPNLSLSYKGQSSFVNANSEFLGLVWQGQGLKLDNGGGSVLYIATNVFPTLGYFAVNGAQFNTDFSRLSGTKTTVYSGITTVGQEPYSITQF